MHMDDNNKTYQTLLLDNIHDRKQESLGFLNEAMTPHLCKAQADHIDREKDFSFGWRILGTWQWHFDILDKTLSYLSE